MSGIDRFQVGDIVIRRGGGERRLVRMVDKYRETIGTVPWKDWQEHKHDEPLVDAWSHYQRVRA